jgi:hypothetical protein
MQTMKARVVRTSKTMQGVKEFTTLPATFAANEWPPTGGTRPTWRLTTSRAGELNKWLEMVFIRLL